MRQSSHYHCEAKMITRTEGRSVVAAAAYIGREAMTNERTGLTHDYRRLGGLVDKGLMAPAGSPVWANDAEQLWNEAEKREDKSTRRATAQTGREFILALPVEISDEGRLLAVQEFSSFMVERYGVAVEYAIHTSHAGHDERNHHAHVLTSTRRLTDAGFAGKVDELDRKATAKIELEAIREKWAEIENKAYVREGFEIMVDHRSYERQGKNQTPTVHLGVEASAMERRGELSDRGDVNRAAIATNEERARLMAEFDQLGNQIKAEETARLERAEKREEAAAIRTNNPADILASITEKRSTFSEAELLATLRRTGNSSEDAKRLARAVLQQAGVVGLAEREGGKVSRYTTQEVLNHEATGLFSAFALATDRSHAVGRSTVQRVTESAAFGTMSAEQYTAFMKATGPEGLSIIAGEAGTGKSYAANAIRTAYEAEGADVRGLAVTNKVIQDMGRDGFTNTRTIHGFLMDIDKGRANLSHNTVLMIDEGGMLSTKQLVNVLAAAQQAGAKVITIQDQAQLGSAYSRGGLSGAIEEQHPELISRLQEVRRIRDTAPEADDQKRAFNLMHGGRFREALGIFDKQGAIHWEQTKDQARAALAVEYAKGLEDKPQARRFALASTNAEVLALNSELRAIHRARGDLGEDKTLNVKDGALQFAEGDRVQFTGSAYKADARRAGLANGNTGTLRQIEGNRVTVELDGKTAKGGKPRLISFTVGENVRAGEFNQMRHGYAGTVYRSQGSTLDVVYRLHGGNERAASNYVGNTRHTERLHIFTSREAIRGLDPWMSEKAGFAGLSEGKQQSAQRGYEKWAEANPELGKRYSLVNYVDYVQDKWTEEKGRSLDIQQLADSMARREENRAASQFVRVTAPAPDTAQARKLDEAKKAGFIPRAGRMAQAVGEAITEAYQKARDWVTTHLDGTQAGPSVAPTVDPVRAEVERYLELCKDPSRDLAAWAAVDAKAGVAAAGVPLPVVDTGREPTRDYSALKEIEDDARRVREELQQEQERAKEREKAKDTATGRGKAGAGMSTPAKPPKAATGAADAKQGGADSTPLATGENGAVKPTSAEPDWFAAADQAAEIAAKKAADKLPGRGLDRGPTRGR
jgi:Ti-type conjugative transfer relaxase TraA